MAESKIPRVALIGRTNVGKSTLFNRMLEQPKALVSDIAGTTRDRNEGECLWRGQVIQLIDTGGLDINDKNAIERDTVKQAKLAMKQADLLLFILDAKVGPVPHDKELARMLKQSNTPVLIVANKAEKASDRAMLVSSEWYLSGLSSPIAVSAVRGSGIGDLLDEIYDALKKQGKPPIEAEQIDATRIAVIGKPNVGKSTLLNAIIGEERFITSSIAHTTREPNDTLVKLGEKNYVFVDTAGMRKHGKVKKSGGLEELAVRRNEFVVRHADVALLVIEAHEPIGAQEKILAGFLKESGCGVIVVVNKWDLVEDKTTTTINRYREYILASIPYLKFAPVLFVSALNKQRVHDLFKMIDTVQKNRSSWIDEKALETFLRVAIKTHAPMKGSGQQVPKVMGLKQVGVAPVKFDLILKAKRTDALSVAYVRYLTNRLTASFPLEGTPIFINIRITKSSG